MNPCCDNRDNQTAPILGASFRICTFLKYSSLASQDCLTILKLSSFDKGREEFEKKHELRFIIRIFFKYSSLASQVLKDGSELDEETNSSFTDQEKSERKLQF